MARKYTEKTVTMESQDTMTRVTMEMAMMTRDTTSMETTFRCLRLND